MKKELEKTFDELYNLQDDWDGEGSLKPNHQTIKTAFEFIEKITSLLYNQYNLQLMEPNVDVGYIGSIDIILENSKGHFLIMFQKDGEEIKSSYYGRHFDTDLIIDGKIINYDIITIWLKEIL